MEEDSALPIISSTFRTKRQSTDSNDNGDERRRRRAQKLTDIVIGRSKKKKKKKKEKEEEVERRIRALQRIVPGGESLGVDELFGETAGYIMALQSQLKAMKTLANLFQPLHNHNTKFGG